MNKNIEVRRATETQFVTHSQRMDSYLKELKRKSEEGLNKKLKKEYALNRRKES